MKGETEMSEPIAKEVKVQLERKMTQVQDAARGIPESHFIEYQAAQRAVDRAIQNSSKEIQQAVRGIGEIRRKFEGAFETTEKQVASQKPTGEKLASVLYGGAPLDLCGSRNFELPFIHGTADEDFNTESPVTEVMSGIVGWGDHSNPHPRIVNMGEGDGIITGNLDLYWRAQVPHDGIFALRPDQWKSSFPIYGRHTVSGSAWHVSSDAARAEVHSWVILYLDSQWLKFGHWVISSDAARSENRTRSFSAWIDLPGWTPFQARAGQELGMIVRLHCFTWASEECLAEILIDSFGLPSNAWWDMNLDVMD